MNMLEDPEKICHHSTSFFGSLARIGHVTEFRYKAVSGAAHCAPPGLISH